MTNVPTNTAWVITRIQCTCIQMVKRGLVEPARSGRLRSLSPHLLVLRRVSSPAAVAGQLLAGWVSEPTVIKRCDGLGRRPQHPDPPPHLLPPAFPLAPGTYLTSDGRSVRVTLPSPLCQRKVTQSHVAAT